VHFIEDKLHGLTRKVIILGTFHTRGVPVFGPVEQIQRNAEWLSRSDVTVFPVQKFLEEIAFFSFETRIMFQKCIFTRNGRGRFSSSSNLSPRVERK